MPTTRIPKSHYPAASRKAEGAREGVLARRAYAARSLEARLVRRVHSLFTYLGRFAQPSRGLDPPRNPPRLRQTLSHRPLPNWGETHPAIRSVPLVILTMLLFAGDFRLEIRIFDRSRPIRFNPLSLSLSLFLFR